MSLISSPKPESISSQHPAVHAVVRNFFEQRLPHALFHFGGGDAHSDESTPKTDLLIAGPDDNHKRQHVFHTLRWGGQFICAGFNRRQISELEKAYGITGTTGFHIEQPTTSVGLNPLPFNLPGMTRRCYYFVARKVVHFLPHELHKRFTFDVWLEPNPDAPDGYVVRKRLPTKKRVLANMTQRFPEIKEGVLVRRVEYLLERVFPMILTREVTMLYRLQKVLPPKIRHRFPALAGMVQGDNGSVVELDMPWIRMGTKPIAHMALASEAALLLKAIHDTAGIWHLDLRLDNMLITHEGVAIIDFGSAVQAREDLSRSKTLRNFYNEVMKTCEIQRVLHQMVEKGQVTCPRLKAIYGKVDPLVDTFYLALQMVKPTRNPDLAALVDYEPGRPEVEQLTALTRSFLNPRQSQRNSVHDAASLLNGIVRIQKRLHMEKASAQKRRQESNR